MFYFSGVQHRRRKWAQEHKQYFSKLHSLNPRVFLERKKKGQMLTQLVWAQVQFALEDPIFDLRDRIGLSSESIPQLFFYLIKYLHTKKKNHILPQSYTYLSFVAKTENIPKLVWPHPHQDFVRGPPSMFFEVQLTIAHVSAHTPKKTPCFKQKNCKDAEKRNSNSNYLHQQDTVFHRCETRRENFLINLEREVAHACVEDSYITKRYKILILFSSIGMYTHALKAEHLQ